jgi:hypothetical protein
MARLKIEEHRVAKVPACEPRGNTLKRLKDLHLKAKTRICRRLSHMCHICSTAASTGTHSTGYRKEV